MSKLRQFLDAKALTMAEFGSQVGCTHATVSRICAGKHQPSFDLARKIVRATGGEVSFEDLATSEVMSGAKLDAAEQAAA